MILFINTTDREKGLIALIGRDKVHKCVFKMRGRASEVLPVELRKFLVKKKHKFEGIKKIAVAKGPGSFMGSRSGVAYANAFARVLGIPVAGVDTDRVPTNLLDLNKVHYSYKVVTPRYGAGKSS